MSCLEPLVVKGLATMNNCLTMKYPSGRRKAFGETKECSEFSKQFLERRSKYKNQMRQKNAHIDDMCKPAPAINPNQSSNDFQEIKGKGKKVKKNKMTKLDNRILGFSVTAAPDRLNVGDRDYGDNV